MRTKLAIFVALIGLLGQSLQAEEVLFEGGRVTVEWSPDAQYMSIDAWVETPISEAQSRVWILTIDSRRFVDGIFAWQIHYSDTMDSVLVLPNDFLTARNFTTTQLGIEAELTDAGRRLHLQVPALGAIPHLISAGDRIEVHALWVQQAPLLTFIVPVPGAIATMLPAGGGAAANLDSEINASPASDVASAPESEAADPSVSLVPTATSYVQGDPIAHQFVLQGTAISSGVGRVVLSYTLMRLHDGQASEFVRFAHVAYDFEISVYSYSIDTTNLTPGLYSLLIGSSNSPLSAQLTVEITPPPG
ncbi:hypothetical protein KKG90_09155 [Candidatus Bipolaricaulota bacterium]|nr:hypothetical protein [Candidatus Bipolaricaulota bacterium]